MVTSAPTMRRIKRRKQTTTSKSRSKILQEEVFEKRESTHRKITKMTTKRLEKLLKQVENGEQVEAEDNSEFHVDEGTGEY